MTRSIRTAGGLLAGLGLLFGVLTALPGDQAAAGQERHDPSAGHAGHAGHAAHGGQGAHAGHSIERDAEGRRLHGMEHQMPPQMYQELRERVAMYRDYTDAEIDLSMQMMGPEYQWYISPDGLRGSAGVIVLLHGFREQGDRLFRQRVQAMADAFPTSLAIGMGMMMSDHVQLSIDDLEDAGVERIVVLPVASSPDNELYRQWRYIFGHREQPQWATVPQVTTRSAQVVFAEPPGDHPLVADILLDHAREVSTEPSREVVIVVSHGPTSSSDNRVVVDMLNRLAGGVREQGGFVGALGMTLQDDAPAEVRAANVAALRAEVASARAAGHDVLIVTNLIGSRSIQAKLRSDLAGLDYRFNAKGIVEHDKFIQWMNEALRAALAGSHGGAS